MGPIKLDRGMEKGWLESGMSYKGAIGGLWTTEGHREGRCRKESFQARYVSPTRSSLSPLTLLIRPWIGTK